MNYLLYFLKPNRWLYAFRHPRRAIRSLRYLQQRDQLFQIGKNVESLVPADLGFLLYESVLGAKSASQNVIEVGAFKGASTCYLSLAAAKVGKRVKSFEIFSGLPTADPVLDHRFHLGQFASDVVEYEHNIKTWGQQDVVDLVIGDARENLAPVITGGKGFSVAFLDVDVYDVMRKLLAQLWCEAKGGELIIVHDVSSPGVREAIDEFHTISKKLCKENIIEKLDTSILRVPSKLPH